jgi:hypothetical protein
MVAIASVVAPELFMGMRQEEIAKACDVDITQFRWLQSEVRATLAGRERPRNRRGSP